MHGRDGEILPGGGWKESAAAYIAFQDAGDVHRTLLLDPIMLAACEDVAGRRVLDLGCGEGRFCRMLRERDAETVGLDFTAGMVTVARDRDPGGRYVLGDAAALPFAGRTFDLVVSYITLVDIPDFRSAISESARVLGRGGRMVVANLGSISTASEPWDRGPDGRRTWRRVDRYAEEFSRVYEWLGIRIENRHRPLSAYMQAYLSAGLRLLAFEEPVPGDASLREDERFDDWFRIPEFTVMVWRRE
ncbi:MAG: class I SAM-dependent methyltransferase [Chloroflexi bacterium]|nr:class I SAM-dependent methyltransferase [Chloroflexota bacterium]